MGKDQKSKNLQTHWATRSLLAVSLAASVTAFGCTTNHNLGNGTPTRSGPEIRTAPTSGVTSGSERETPPIPPPMTSSSSASRADQAAAIMAQHQPVRGRYLGVVNPGPATRGYVSDARVTGQLIPPALLANPQLTINSTISSNPFPAITSGATAAPTAASAALPTGTFAAAGSTLPTVASSAIPTVTTVAGTAPSATAASAVRIERGTTGAVVTNVAAPTTATGRSN